MTNAFVEVIKDLWSFVTLSDTGTFSEEKGETEKVPDFKQNTDSVSEVHMPPTRFDVQDEIEQVAYVATNQAVCLAQPDKLFDSKLATLYYGDKVVSSRISDDYVEVATESVKGWVETGSLNTERNEVLPYFVTNHTYDSTNAEVVKLRQCIRDEALGGELGLSLQSTELLLYLFKINNIRVNWPITRPRIPGLWNVALRGVKGVSIGILPRTNSIIEYVKNEKEGFIGFVEAVHPDMSIIIRSVGRKKMGEYRVEEFTRNEWKEWRPVFISFL